MWGGGEKGGRDSGMHEKEGGGRKGVGNEISS